MIGSTSLRWKLMLTLALCPVLVLSAEYCVKPTTAPATKLQIDNVMGTPCLVFNDYLADQDRYFKSNTTFKFLPGIHEMNKSLHIENVDNFQLVRASNKTSRDEISITGSNDADIIFRHHSNIKIEGISFYLCPLLAWSLNFFNGTNLTLLYVELNQPCVQQSAQISHQVNANISYLSTSASTLYVYPLSPPVIWLLDVFNLSISHLEPSYDQMGNRHFLLIEIFLYNYHTPGYEGFFIEIESIVCCGGLGFNLDNRYDKQIKIIVKNSYFHECGERFPPNVDLGPGLSLSVDIDNTYHVNTTYKVFIENCTFSGNQNGLVIDNLPPSSSVVVRNSKFSKNKVQSDGYINLYDRESPPTAVTIFHYIQWPHGFKSGIFVFINVTFEDNMDLATLGTLNTSPAVRITGSNVHFSDCQFLSNRGTALHIQSSNISFEGTTTFFNNTGYNGGAMLISGMSFLSSCKLLENISANILFDSYHAEHTGGAILIDTTTIWLPYCFLRDCHLNLFFSSNTAQQGGNDVYGGNLDLEAVCNVPNTCLGMQIDMQCVGSDRVGYSCINMVNNISTFSNPTPSSIASDPTRVCLCHASGTPDCLNNILSGDVTVYPGQLVTISVVAVGQHFGTAAGFVCAQLLALNHNTSSMHSSSLSPQECQSLKHYRCNQINYTIYSNKRDEILVLTTDRTNVTKYGDNSTINEAIDDYNSSHHNLSVPLFLLVTPVYINITVKACPTGFSLTRSSPFYCTCDQQLSSLEGKFSVSCDINTQTVQRRGTVWIGVSGNTTDGNGVIVTEYCPYYYCSEKNVNVSLSKQINNALSNYTSDETQYENISFHSEPDPQCNFNRSGRLCGRCPVGQSVALGTSQCLKCSNNYLSLLVPFAVAGVLLVFFIKVLNLTPAQGLINGLIFYANIVKANEYIFFPQKQTNFLTVFISWLNLDLGIETCFFDGLDGYWKTWLQFVFPLYVWVIAFAMIVLARYSIRVARLLGNNSVPVLVTLVYLSYAKLFRTVLTTIHYTVLEYPSGHHKVVWSYDGTIEYLSPKHTVLFAVALLALLFMWLPYTCVLLFGQWLNRCSNRKISMLMFKMKPLFDAHYGPFKDNHRYWFGVLLGARAVILLTSSVVPLSSSSVNSMAIIVVVGVLFTHSYTVGRVYRKFYVSLIEAAFFLNLTILAATVLYTDNDSNQLTLSYIMTGAAFAKFVVIVAIHLFLSVKALCYRALGLKDDHLLINQHEDEDLDFDRNLAQSVRNN